MLSDSSYYLSFFFQILLVIVGSVSFHINFSISLYMSIKNLSWNIDKNFIIPIDEFEENCYLYSVEFSSL